MISYEHQERTLVFKPLKIFHILFKYKEEPLFESRIFTFLVSLLRITFMEMDFVNTLFVFIKILQGDVPILFRSATCGEIV